MLKKPEKSTYHRILTHSPFFFLHFKGTLRKILNVNLNLTVGLKPKMK